AEDPRARRPADAFLLVVCVVVALLALWSHRAPSDFDVRILDLVSDRLPGWISATFVFAFVLGGLYSAGLLVAMAVFGRDRPAVARDMALAVALALGLALALSAIAGGGWPQFLPEVTDRSGTPPYPVVRVGISYALVTVAGPYLTLPMRLLGRRLMILMVVSAVVLSYGTISSVIGGIAMGVGAASIIRLIFGSGVGIPSRARILDALADSGLPAVELHFLDDQPIGRTLVKAELAGGTEALVKIYGRDAADAALASRLWRMMWYTDLDRSLSAPGLQQVEHESLMLLECDRRTVPAAELLGWGRGVDGDALIATRWPEAPSLGDLAADEIDDGVLDRCWQTLDRWHNANMAHRQIDTGLILLADDGPILDDLSAAVASPTPTTLAIDIAQMLVATAVAVGPQRATAAALAGIGPERLADALPLTQRSAMSSRLTGQAKQAGLDLKALRTEMAEAIDAEPPDLVQLERVTWGGVAMLLLTLVAIWTLVSSLADIGFDTIVDQFAEARWSWVVTAFVLAQLVNVGEYLSLTGMVHRPVPFGPTIIFRYALDFVSLAVPSEAGAIAMNIRYMRKLGVPTAAAVAQGPLLTVVSKGVDIVLLLLSIRVVGESITLDDVDAGPALRLALLVVVLFVVGVIVTFAVPGVRRRIVPQLKVAYTDIRQSITDPQRLLRLVGGALAGRLLFAMTLSASVSAFGSSITFTEAVFVNSAVGLLVGLMPVPGGIGIGEAALAAGLTLVDVPESAAFAAALSHRMVANYLPPIYGFFAIRWLTERDYL
ncbi:MAG: flippase-like domain-containing protein, partial [Acidimicrobiia bacterium]|nr:flippase-like domain-containing protein [Acidimicrobiia bacterium]